MNLTTRFETPYWRTGTIVVGVDEVGRGALAGPVVVGAVCFHTGHKAIPGIYDSKQVSRKRREALAPLIQQDCLGAGIGQVEAWEIDQIGIVAALVKAADAAITTLYKPGMIILSDGPRPLHSLKFESQSIIHGDALVYSIAAASILAKVYRDRLMEDLSRTYPGYGWERNVGYGTKEHMLAIQNLGYTREHRRTFNESK